MILNLGCGLRKEQWPPNSDGLDKFDFGQKYIWDLERIDKPWPIHTNEYAEIWMFHLFEHIAAPAACINILNEIWRVGKPGAVFKGAAPHYIRSKNFTRDFYHIREISEHTFDAYLEGSTIHFNDYGVKCLFRKREIYVDANQDVQWVLEIVK